MYSYIFFTVLSILLNTQPCNPSPINEFDVSLNGVGVKTPIEAKILGGIGIPAYLLPMTIQSEHPTPSTAASPSPTKSPLSSMTSSPLSTSTSSSGNGTASLKNNHTASMRSTGASSMGIPDKNVTSQKGSPLRRSSPQNLTLEGITGPSQQNTGVYGSSTPGMGTRMGGSSVPNMGMSNAPTLTPNVGTTPNRNPGMPNANMDLSDSSTSGMGATGSSVPNMGMSTGQTMNPNIDVTPGAPSPYKASSMQMEQAGPSNMAQSAPVSLDNEVPTSHHGSRKHRNKNQMSQTSGGSTLPGLPDNLSPETKKQIEKQLRSAGNLGNRQVQVTVDNGPGGMQTFNPFVQAHQQRPAQRQQPVDLMKNLKSWMNQPRPYQPTPVDTSSLENANQMDKLNQDCLIRHNQIRKSLNLQPFTFSMAAVRFAEGRIQTLASSTVFKHDMNPFREFGENLYRYRGKQFWDSCDFVVYTWATKERPLYHGQGIGTGQGMYTHYTAIIWPASNQMGCAQGIGKDDKHYVVCGYYPRGNDAGVRLQVY